MYFCKDKPSCSTFRVITANFRVSEILVFSRYRLFQGQLPKQLYIGMVSNEGLNGTVATTPFFFQKFDLSKLDVTCDGYSVYVNPLEP